MNLAAKDARFTAKKKRERRAYNVVVRGILPNESDPDHDATAVESFLSSVCNELVIVKKVQRLHHAKPKEVNGFDGKIQTSAVLAILSEQQKTKRS